MSGQRDTQVDLEQLVASTNTGGRQPVGWQARVLAGIALAWSLFQIYYASNIPFILSDWTGWNVALNSDSARSIHLSFAMILAAMSYPLTSRSPNQHIPLYDWLLAALGVAACMYMVAFSDQIASRAGLPTTADLVMSTIGLVLLLLFAYRALGLPMVLVALFFLAYVFFGDQRWLPEVVQWKGASYGKAMWHFWMQTEGVFGIALGLSASMIFLFVLFGSLLEKAGAGNYFVQVSFALLGHLRGGPAKAAVMSSAMTGVISGSSIANTVTTGTFTIPLMKRVGFSSEKAGAVEVSSSVNGQLMPPVMGAAAFLMVEYVGISYVDVIRHALLPAVISYIALLYIVHLEALKAGMTGLPKPGADRPLTVKAMGFLGGFGGFGAVCALIYFGLDWAKSLFGEQVFWVVLAGFAGAYLALLALAASRPDLVVDDPDAPIGALPKPLPTAITGFYFLLPVVVLVWCLMIERFSPGLSAYWATIAMIAILVTQKPIKALFRGGENVTRACAEGFGDLVKGLIAGARNMTSIAIATAVAGIIVGTISLTGFHYVMGEFIEYLAGGSLMVMLLLVAVLSIVLGMGLPTTANYIVVSSLMAFVIVDVGAQNGLIVPLIAVHLFVFYFGIMADVTPPVGLASFAAAAVSGGDPLKTGFTAFFYSLRTVLLPFLFIFNTDLLLIDVTWLEGIVVFVVALVAMLLVAAATQGYFLVRSRLWESAVLGLVAFTLFRPGYWLDQWQAPFDTQPGVEIEAAAAEAAPGSDLRVVVSGEDFGGKMVEKTVTFTMGAPASGPERLMRDAGLAVRLDGGRALVDDLAFQGPAEKTQIDFDWEIVSIQTPAERWPKEIFYIPALLLLAVVVLAQWARRPEPARV